MKLLVALGTDYASPDQLLLAQSLTSLRRRVGVEGEGVMRTGGGGSFSGGRAMGGVGPCPFAASLTTSSLSFRSLSQPCLVEVKR